MQFCRRSFVFRHLQGGLIPRSMRSARHAVRCFEGLPDAIAGLRYQSPAMMIVCGPPATHSYLALRHATGVPMLVLLSQASEAVVLDVFDAGADDCHALRHG